MDMNHNDNSSPPKLISLDVGGTLGFAKGQTITNILNNVSNLPKSDVHRILRSTLHVAPNITEVLINRVCTMLGIDPALFPRNYVAPAFQLYPQTLPSIKSLRKCAPLVTLSNVSCLDFKIETLQKMIGDYISGQYPSCILGYAKPDKRAFESVIDQHQISIRSLVHIGDNWECDIVGAISAGARAIWIAGERTAPNEPSIRTDKLTIVKDILEASKYLESLADNFTRHMIY
jgi:FMN hydrolase / 5-amino-6-(5-phospho-D-ribitylamino)uracil phosphatase